jgi:hypothetical protein
VTQLPKPNRFIENIRGKSPSWIRKLIVFIIGVGSFGVLFYILFQQREILLSYEWDIQYGYLLISFFIYSLNLFLATVVWAWIMNALGGNTKMLKHFSYYSLSNAAKRLPGTVWYIASRTQLYKTEDIPYRVTSLGSGIEFVIALVTSIFVSLLFGFQIVVDYQYGLVGMIGLFLIGIVLLHPALLRWVMLKFRINSHTYQYSKLILWILVYLLAWALAGMMIYSIGNAITPIDISHLLYIIGSLGLINVVTSALLFAPSNLGITEVGMSLLLARIMPAPIAVILAITVRILVTLYDLIWAGVSSFVISRLESAN